jgi:Transposase DDE domain
MASPSDALTPLGVSPPTRSTLAEAHERRPTALDQRLLATLDARGQAVAPGHGFRVNNPRLSLDSTTISLGLHRFPWARFRTATGALTVPTLLDHAGHLPALVVMTEGQGSDLAMARGLQLPQGSLVAMDRGDIDDGFLCRLTQDGVYCVPRQQVKATCQVTARLAVNWLQGVTSDQHVVLRGKNGPAYPDALRRVGYRAPETGNHDVFWTNAFHLAAATLAALYQARWQLELFFKTIKQNLKIKTFLGTSENAVITPMWSALITYLMLAFLRFKSGLGLSFQQLLRLLQINLFDRRNLVDLCHPPQRQASQGQQLYAA